MKLRSKIITWFITIQVITAIILITASIGYLYYKGKENIEVHANDALVLISAAVAESLFVVNLNSAKEIIDSAFYEIEGISFLQIRGENDEMLAEKRKGNDLIFPSIKIKRTIELGGITFGTLYMHFSLGNLYHLLWDQTIMLSAFGLLIISISALVVFYAANSVIKIIDKMEAGFNTLLVNKIPSMIDEHDSSLTSLVTSYNELIKKSTAKF